MPDSSDIDAALVAKLGADATLLGYMPNGVYIDQAPSGFTRFVLVSLVISNDEPMQTGARAYEETVYTVTARGLETASAALPANTMKNAAARIDALLEGGTMTVTGYKLMNMRRIERIRDIEVDEADETIRWHIRGGRYEIVVSTP